jgi:hypothetical protein
VTTTVVIRSPAPNHQDLHVEIQQVGRDGAWRPQGSPIRVKEGGLLSQHVYRGQRLVITEVEREAPPAATAG